MQELVNQIEELKNHVYNLELYLDYVRQKDPGLWKRMKREFIGLPVYKEAVYTPK